MSKVKISWRNVPITYEKTDEFQHMIKEAVEKIDVFRHIDPSKIVMVKAEKEGKKTWSYEAKIRKIHPAVRVAEDCKHKFVIILSPIFYQSDEEEKKKCIIHELFHIKPDFEHLRHHVGFSDELISKLYEEMKKK